MIWLFLSIPIFVVIAGIIVRPFYIHLGLTDEEWNKKWPGDDLVAGALPSGSRAIVIHAPASEVWTWITQIGQDRAGFNSYRWLENLAGAQMPDVTGRRVQWSDRQVGQTLIMAPPKRYGKIAMMDIVEAETGHYFVAKNFEGTWAFIVDAINSQNCRFVARGMWLPSKNPIARFAHSAIFDPIHSLMEWKMVREVKRLAEVDWIQNRSLRGTKA